MTTTDYWKECISIAADECSLVLTPNQLDYLVDSIELGREHYSSAFYSPPASDRLNELEREWKAKYQALQKEFDSYRNDAETAVKLALRQHSTANVSIGKYGEVTRFDGRATVIQ